METLREDDERVSMSSFNCNLERCFYWLIIPARLSIKSSLAVYIHLDSLYRHAAVLMHIRTALQSLVNLNHSDYHITRVCNG